MSVQKFDWIPSAYKNMHNIIIRPARLTDIKILRKFEQGVIAAERPYDPTLNPNPISYYNVEEMIASVEVNLVVAEQAGELIGCGYARIENSKLYLRHVCHGYLGFMYVLPTYRGRGVNKLIIEALKEWLSKQGVNELRLEVYTENLAAIKAYENAGFTSHMLEMRQALNQ